MKIRAVKTFLDNHGTTRRGAMAEVADYAGKELVGRGLAVQIADVDAVAHSDENANTAAERTASLNTGEPVGDVSIAFDGAAATELPPASDASVVQDTVDPPAVTKPAKAATKAK